MSHNALPTLPEGLGRLRHLRELLASSNELRSLPLSLATLPQLFVLALQGNAFSALPEVCLRCSRLRHLKWGAQRPRASGAGGDNQPRAGSDAHRRAARRAHVGGGPDLGLGLGLG